MIRRHVIFFICVGFLGEGGKAKPQAKVRPLAAPDALRRLTGGTICSQLKQKFREDLSPHQFAVAVSAGCEVVQKCVSALAELDPELVVIAVDVIAAGIHLLHDFLFGKRLQRSLNGNCSCPCGAYAADDQNTQAISIDNFLDLRRGMLTLLEYLAEHEYCLEEAERLGGRTNPGIPRK